MKLEELKIALKYPRLNIRQLFVLFMLSKDKILTRDIAHEMQIPKASVSRAFDSLCNMKLIKRERDETDGHKVYGVITDAGKKFVREIS